MGPYILNNEDKKELLNNPLSVGTIYPVYTECPNGTFICDHVVENYIFRDGWNVPTFQNLFLLQVRIKC